MEFYTGPQGRQANTPEQCVSIVPLAVRNVLLFSEIVTL